MFEIDNLIQASTNIQSVLLSRFFPAFAMKCVPLPSLACRLMISPWWWCVYFEGDRPVVSDRFCVHRGRRFVLDASAHVGYGRSLGPCEYCRRIRRVGS